MDNVKYSSNSREDLIKELYCSFQNNQLPDESEKNYYFDEGTGTWYLLTGKNRIDRPSIELAQKYFEDVLRPLKDAKVGTAQYTKALYCAIAIEAINKFINS